MEKWVVALGGNALLGPKEKQFALSEIRNASRAMDTIARAAVKRNAMLVITHGNGPQVGDEIIKNELSKRELPMLPLFLMNAETQGSIGSILATALRNSLFKIGAKRGIGAIITHVVVDKEDIAFKNPTKPVGPIYTKRKLEAEIKIARFRYIKEGGGYRRVVSSPYPKEVLEIGEIGKMLERGEMVIAGGGGGIPVVKIGKAFKGVDAVIDKDLASLVLANGIDADRLIILTDVDYVYKDFKNKRGPIKRASAGYMQSILSTFEEGTIKPKVEACIKFVEGDRNRKAYIGNLMKLEDILKGVSGTHIYAE
ncbi:MAG: carbamate kinase [Candidatus Micrarchaeaceae archaeon]